MGKREEISGWPEDYRAAFFAAWGVMEATGLEPATDRMAKLMHA